MTHDSRRGLDVDVFMARLDSAIPAPARSKHALLDEARDALQDAARAYREIGLEAADAEAAAVRDFGPVSVVAPLYQYETAMTQVRRTARKLCASLGVLLVTWLSIAAVDHPARHLSGCEIAAAHLAGLAVALAFVGAVTVAVATRRVAGPRPTRLPAIVGGVAIAGSLASAAALTALLIGAHLDPVITAPVSVFSTATLVALAWSGTLCRRTPAAKDEADPSRCPVAA